MAKPRLVPIGFGSLVVPARVLAVLNPAGSPARRLREESRERGHLVDATQGRKTRSMILLDTGHLVLSGVQAETVAQRIEKGLEPLTEDPA